MFVEFRNMLDSLGNLAYNRVLGFTGANQATAEPVLFSVTPWGIIPRYNLPAGNTVLTQTIMRAGVLTGTSAGATSVLIPTMASLGYTRDATNPRDLAFIVQGNGLGGLAVNANQFLGDVASQAAMLALTGQVGDFCRRTDLGNSMYELTALPASTLANWTLRNGANAPTTAGIVLTKNNIDPLYLGVGHPFVLITSYGQDMWSFS